MQVTRSCARQAIWLRFTRTFYVDVGSAVPFLSTAGMRQVVQMLIELCPTSKIMYSSNAHLIPEMYYLGAKCGRTVLGNVLQRAVEDADLTVKEAEEGAIAILNGNAQRLYRC